MKIKYLIAAFCVAVFTFVGCAYAPPSGGQGSNGSQTEGQPPETFPEEQLPALPDLESPVQPEVPEAPSIPEAPSVPETPGVQPEAPEDPSVPQAPSAPQAPAPEPETQTVKYIKVNASSVNLRSGAGTSYSIKGSAEINTLYAYLGTVDGWYKLRYKNSVVYVSKKYCTIVEMESSPNDEIEEVIEDGTQYLGVKYVYGAVRYHDGKGNKLKGFTDTKFDCSSLMQYIFYTGAGELLNVNTRTQVFQGKTVKKSQIKRGDLLFFTNAQRYNNSGVERVGHVAVYLGDNYILHTASDYAKIEQISQKRWSYFIQAQRII